MTLQRRIHILLKLKTYIWEGINWRGLTVSMSGKCISHIINKMSNNAGRHLVTVQVTHL